ncbi:MAG TPA: hypothetical protein PLB41_02530 [Rubrivivax sp.]|nr:hypothetical protein [Rubrivivax sp.]HPO19363.1 hypothetical protein [Rubrivivax sp.]
MSATQAAAPQVLALLDDAAAGRALLEISAALARLMQRELSVVYVESQHALHAAALPFAQVLSPQAGQWRALQPGEIEQGFKAQAARLRQLSAHIALREAVHCTLRVTRGSLGQMAAELQAESDLLLRAGTAAYGAPAASARPPRPPRLVLMRDGGEAAARARRVAAQLAQSLHAVLEPVPLTLLEQAAHRADLLVLPRGVLDARQLARLRCAVLLVG